MPGGRIAATRVVAEQARLVPGEACRAGMSGAIVAGSSVDVPRGAPGAVGTRAGDLP